MKTTKLFAAICAAAAIFACTPEDQPGNENHGQPENVKIAASPASVTFEADGGTVRVSVNVADYSVEGSASWLTVSAEGKELTLVAETNTVNETRSCTLTLLASDSSCKLEVSQKPGSPYPGYGMLNSIIYEYAGTSLYMFSKPVTENYGGMAFLTLENEDVKVELQLCTSLFASEEDVVVELGEYTAGLDYSGGEMILYAVPQTFVPGTTLYTADGEGLPMGSQVEYLLEGSSKLIQGGSFEIRMNESSEYVIKIDLVDEDGAELKFVYVGEIEIDLESAGYPSVGEEELPDPTAGIVSAKIMLLETSEDGSMNTWALHLISESGADSIFEINVPADAEDFSGSYYYFAPSNDEGDEDYEDYEEYDDEEYGDYGDYDEEYGDEDYEGEEGYIGTANPGMGFELPTGMVMPMGGSYISYIGADITQFEIADQMISAILNKNEDGSYNFTGVLMGNGFMYMYMGPAFSGYDINIEIVGSEDVEDED